MINREQIQGENKERFSEELFKAPTPPVTLHAASCIIWRDSNTFTTQHSDTIKEELGAGAGPGRQHLEGARFKRNKRARNRARISRRKCTPNKKKKKNPLVPPALHTSDQIPGGEAPFEERLMGFPTVYAVKSVKAPCVSTLFPLYSRANQESLACPHSRVRRNRPVLSTTSRDQFIGNETLLK